ncbi:DUF493 family protein [Desulfonatronum sp. SC1]|uniref:DUF493 family protein n=1 Tax=Desulfonatronum sp. SC1 TaxID=2109626 RepID=UPI000D2F7443|nr:DUF493 family protein [Desulfonatronum sp. SC1]PTN39067.1 DUF493 domain-containing protein [Desulfonatronum sp. SC1]
MKDFDQFRKLLDEQCQWPSVYTFKFIVPKARAEELLAVFRSCPEVSVRESSQGKYLSVTANMLMSSSDGVVAVYEAVAGIEGIIAL